MYRRGAKGWAKHLDFIILDIVCLELALLVAVIIRHRVFNLFQSGEYGALFLIVGLIDFVSILCLDTMKNVLKRGYYKEFVTSFSHSMVVFLSTTAYLFLMQEGAAYSRIALVLMLDFHVIFSYITRVIWKIIIRRQMAELNNKSILIMASEKSVPLLIRAVEENHYGMDQITGIILPGNDQVGQCIEGISVVAAYDTLVDYVTGHWVDELLVCMNPGEQLPGDVLESLTAMGITVHVTVDTFASKVPVKQTVSNIGGLLVITSVMNYMRPREYFIKRCLDILGGIVGCILTGILCIFLAPAIKHESPGPLFFTQMRVGRNGKPFKLYKFRSMYLDAEERKQELMDQNRNKDGLMFKMEFDPRVIGNRIDEHGNQKTGIGEFIRKYSLDEFPQFFNVLKGDMSLVGTRPPLMSEYSQYSAHHKARLAAKPGITGMWQVSGRNKIVDFEEVVKLDTQYIDNWSVGLDLRILLKTVITVLSGEGAM